MYNVFHSLSISLTKDIYQQNCLEAMSLPSKCDSYSIFKKCKYTEKYLSCVTVEKFRICLARFRCSSHHLLIEKGRFTNIKRERRICRFCNDGDIENEYNFLLVYSAYNALRKKYIKEYYYVHPSLEKFSPLLNCQNDNIIQNLAMFLHYAMLIRQNGVLSNVM